MKLVSHAAPFALALISGLGCTPSSNRGVAAGSPSDSASDPPQQPTTANYEVDSQQPETLSPVRPADPPRRSSAVSPVRPIQVPRPSPYRVRVVDGDMRDLRTFYYEGRSYVLGTVGQRYAIVVSNPTAQRVEAVISVDGLDAIDGASADYVNKRGYILPAYGSATIEGFRTSLDQVATFRFSSVADSYAGRKGQARDVGVIGVAFFPERAPVPVAAAPLARDDERYDHARRAPPPSVQGAAPSPAKSEAAPASPSADVSGLAQESSNGGAVGRSRVQERKGLGTEFGEARDSHVGETPFERSNAVVPSSVVAFRYNDRAGLIALGIRLDPPVVADSEIHTRETADPFRANRFAAPPP